MRGIHADGEAVRRFRKAKDWSQERLAAACGCSTRTIRSAEQGKRIDAETISLIAESLGTGLESLIVGYRVDRDATRRRNEDLLQEYVQSYKSQRVGALLEMHHADSAYQVNLAGTTPDWGKFQGRAGITGHLEVAFAELPMVDFRPIRITAVGDLVFERSEVTMRSTLDGSEFVDQGANVWRLSEGKIVSRSMYIDPKPQLLRLGPKPWQEAAAEGP